MQLKFVSATQAATADPISNNKNIFFNSGASIQEEGVLGEIMLRK